MKEPAAAEADEAEPLADEEQGGIAPAAITFTWEVDGVSRELTVPEGASPGDEREFSFVAADGSTRYFVARIPGSIYGARGGAAALEARAAAVHAAITRALLL